MSILQRDKDAIWHPFTQMKTAEPPIAIESAKGCKLFTVDGEELIDAVSSWWVNIHGHSNPVIAEAIYKQALKMEHIIFAGFTHDPAVTIAERLLALFKGHYSKVFFTDNGSTSVEVGIKMAIQYWHNKDIKSKTKIIAIEEAYHGDTFGSMSVSGRNTFNAPFDEMLFDVSYLPLPNDDNIDQCIDLFNSYCGSDQVAAFIFEPLVQGAGGMRMYSSDNLERLLNLAKQNNVLCIADEVMTGFGRTGTYFATDQVNTKPDIICLSKGITGGFMPLAVTLCTADIYQAFYADEAQKALYHGHSYTANAMACAAANASLDILLSQECKSNIARLVSKNAALLMKLAEHDAVKDARQTGTILAIEFKSPEGTSYFSSLRKDIYDYALDRNVLLRPLGNVMYFMPPYSISDEEINHVHEVMCEIVDFIKKKYF